MNKVALKSLLNKMGYRVKWFNIYLVKKNTPGTILESKEESSINIKLAAYIENGQKY